ncbi:MAG: hypothetical protein IJ426_00800 [Clostridia bacterium]|nr:hypothetical protein [Clostridia bacterium]
MTTEITSTKYENGKRVEVQRVTYEKSDDLYALASVQRRYENLCKQIDNAAEGTDLESLQAEKAKLEAELEEKENIVAGYEATE